MKKYLLSVLLSFILMGIAGATTIDVTVGDFYFSPVSFDAVVGDTVVWTLDSAAVAPHTTTSTSVPAGAAGWDYSFTGVGDSYSYVIEVAGVYEYHCTIHPTTMRASFSTSVALPFYEDFDYPANDNITLHGWVSHSAGGTNPITVNDGGLSFPGYPSSDIGNAALLFGNSEDDHRLFESQVAGSVYMAFMVNATDNPNGYFIHFTINPYSTSYYRGRVYLEGTNPNLEFGLAFATESAVSTSNNYSLGTTYVVVLKYTIVEGDNNDEVSLYVFDGTVPPTEPGTPTLGPISNAAVSDIEPGAVSFRKYSSAQDMVVDGIRISTVWSDVVPVELSSFTASVSGNSVTLNWETATETNNRGFEVQRKTSNSDWTDLYFVNGNGTSTKSHEYTYVDKNLKSDKYYYRLKQADFDGSYELSKVIETEVTAPVKFELAQNYPNPFNPTTKIDFSTPVNANVKLAVYNVLGQEIAVLVKGFMQSGNHSVDFNASDLNSGLYFYKLESNGVSVVKKMMLLK